MNDTIVEEIRRFRDAHAAHFNYDLDAIFRDLKEREKASGLTFADFTAIKVYKVAPPASTQVETSPLPAVSTVDGA